MERLLVPRPVGRQNYCAQRNGVLAVLPSHRGTSNIAFRHTGGDLASKITRENSDHGRVNGILSPGVSQT
jgi:hypothetical protein